MRRGLLLLLLAAAGPEGPSPSEPGPGTRDLQALLAQRVTAAAALRAMEDAELALDARRDTLQEARAAAERAAADAADRLSPLLPVASQLAQYPAETLLSVPASPEQAVRGLLVLRAMAREMQDAVATLTARREEMVRLSQEAAAASSAQRDAADRHRTLSEALDREIAQVQGDIAKDEAAATARRAAADAARAQTLRAAVATLDAKPAPAPVQSATAVVAWTSPVSGRLVRSFGQVGDSGPSTGIVVQAPASARVVAACAGRVAFAGPFRSYGKLLIVECGRGLHAVLAGLERLDAQVGQGVQAGEPIGVMPAAGGALYVEVRRDGAPVDPAAFLFPAH